ncbi:MAG TPA: LamG domain-containing protein [Chitinophagaceae bacterium]|mgnify:FL=1|nr:LamG domain-containing protein [Chitinophagaceae bacterium]HPH33086.1 LamG domain-containing protein [Chitinophagaceae bacterium]
MQPKTIYRILFIALLAIQINASAQAPTNGLQAHFPLNNSNTNSVPGNITASLANLTYTTNNQNTASSAVQFGGNLNSLITFTDNDLLDFTGTTNFTISFSFFFNGSANAGLLDNCLNYSGWGLYLWSPLAGTWNLQFNYKNGSLGSPSTTAFTTGVWHHVTAIRNNGTLSMYIDGVLRASGAEGTQTPSYPTSMIAGAMAYLSYSPPRYNPFGGKMDEIRVYNRALSSTEVAQLNAFVLPLKLGQFSATKKTGQVDLIWETLSEENTSHFEIERSSDGNNWTRIGEVSANGNSTQKQSYSYTDPAPSVLTSFYRLKMADKDGIYTYSRVITVTTATEFTGIRLFPNPARETLQVQYEAARSGSLQLMVTDAGGRIVYQSTVSGRSGINTFSVPVQMLSPGYYQLAILADDRKKSGSFVKE